MEVLKGHIERVTFSSEESSFSVCKVKVKGEKNLVAVVGSMVNPVPGEFVEVEGNWGFHPKFGSQFKIHRYKTLVPATQSGIRNYLGSRLIKGIGPVMAKRIVAKFGVKALDIIENHIDQLQTVEGIGKKRVEMIKAAWEEQKEVRTVMLFLQSHGVSTTYAAKIFKTYGQDAISIVKENPYQLARDIFGIGFITADQIAQKLGMTTEAPQRIEAGIEYVLHQLSDKGHVCYPYRKLGLEAAELLEVGLDLVFSAIAAISAEDRIVIENVPSDIQNASEISRQVFLKKYHVCETGIVKNFHRIQQTGKSVRAINVEKAVEWIKGEVNITFAEKQEAAVRAALEEKVLIITGGPGTGKTTIINAIIKILKKAGAAVLLAAPTGRAARRMSETTWEYAQTIHRLLDYSLQKTGFKKDNKNPLKCDVLIIDEASMIDTLLMHHLMKAVPSRASLILVGDVNQLPSVGAGNVLSDIIASQSFKVVTLDTIFRQARKSLIVVNAHKINQGCFPIIPKKKGRSNFYFIEKEDPEEVLTTIVDLVRTRIPDRFGYDPVDDIQVLTPMHKGQVGAANLNHELQKILNTSSRTLQRGSRIFKQSDKVMQIRNNYDKRTYNGDIGRIIDINFIDQKVMIQFDSREVDYDFSSLDELVHAYAVSVHKSQGSEYPVVVLPVVIQHYMLLQRNLIYTGITRGKKLVVVVGTKKALSIAIRNAKSSQRYTRLIHRLSAAWK